MPFFGHVDVWSVLGILVLVSFVLENGSYPAWLAVLVCTRAPFTSLLCNYYYAPGIKNVLGGGPYVRASGLG